METVSTNEGAGQSDVLMELALQGEPIFVAPPGFFDDIYDEDYVREAQLLEKCSVISPDP